MGSRSPWGYSVPGSDRQAEQSRLNFEGLRSYWYGGVRGAFWKEPPGCRKWPTRGVGGGALHVQAPDLGAHLGGAASLVESRHVQKLIMSRVATEVGRLGVGGARF